MTHKVHPYAQRIGILRDWKSRWFSGGSTYRKHLKTDVLLREYIQKRLKGMYVSSIEMERNEKAFKIIIKTSRPGLVIGRGGEGSEKLNKDIQKFVARHGLSAPQNIRVEIEEVRSPESDATIVAEMVREGIEKRMPFRRVLKQTIDKVIANRDVQGVRIALSGRLGGADMARKEELKKGRVPLQTFRADVDFARVRAHTPQGHIGIKVWIYKGDVFEK